MAQMEPWSFNPLYLCSRGAVISQDVYTAFSVALNSIINVQTVDGLNTVYLSINMTTIRSK